MFRILGGLSALGFLVILTGCGSTKPYSYEFDYGRSVILRNGYAVAPKSAPPEVHRLVAAGNRLQGLPYKYGGGHRNVEDTGYDCSGTVSYALIGAGLLGSPMPSGGFRNYGKKGDGKWITVYAKDGHTFLTVGGLRLDTGYRGEGRGPTWTMRNRPTKGYRQRHPSGL